MLTVCRNWVGVAWRVQIECVKDCVIDTGLVIRMIDGMKRLFVLVLVAGCSHRVSNRPPSTPPVVYRAPAIVDPQPSSPPPEPAPAVELVPSACQQIEAHLRTSMAEVDSRQAAQKKYADEHCKGRLAYTGRVMRGLYGADDIVEGVWLCNGNETKNPEGDELRQLEVQVAFEKKRAKERCGLSLTP